MFERFTVEARRVVVLAQEEARVLHHNHIGTEHILLGLLGVEDDVASRVLAALGLTLEEARARIARILAPSDEVPSGQIPFTPRAKKVLELSLREALALGHNHIGTEHLLLGVLREGDGVAIRVLRDLDVDLDRLRDEVRLQLPAAEGQERTQEEVTVTVRGPRFTVGPDRELHRLLMAAAGQALAAGREEYGLADLLAAAEANRKPSAAPETGPAAEANREPPEATGSGASEASQ